MERGLYTTSEIWKVTLYYYSTSLKAIPPTGIDVTVPWSVCLSVCLSRSCIVLKRQKISTRFLTIGQDMKVETNAVLVHARTCYISSSAISLPDQIKIIACVGQPIPSQILLPSDPYERRRHSVANCGRMVRGSAMATFTVIHT